MLFCTFLCTAFASLTNPEKPFKAAHPCCFNYLRSSLFLFLPLLRDQGLTPNPSPKGDRNIDFILTGHSLFLLLLPDQVMWWYLQDFLFLLRRSFSGYAA